MRVLHLFSDHRWTGPAEPIINLVRAQRAIGVDASLAVARGRKEPESRVTREARSRGVDPIQGLCLDRRRTLGPPITDAFLLRRMLRERRIDVVHTHLSHDHALGAIAARLAGGGVRVVRTSHKGAPLAPKPMDRLLFRRLTHAYHGFSRAAAEVDAARLGIPPDRVFVTNPAVDLDRFDPAKVTPCAKQMLGLSPEHVLGGIVARMQPHRRFDVLLRAVKLAHNRAPTLRFAMIGRGGEAEDVVHRPRRELGLEEVVLLPGYCSEDYAEWVAGLDFKVFLMPGSDGSCRAIREAMALGVPVIGARRGMIPEQVLDGETGIVVVDTEENLAEAMVRLAHDGELRARMGATARRSAEERFRLDRQAAAVAAMYEATLGGKRSLRPAS